ncbi:MAG TPA: 50S ribosomal protein L10 [Candidatus Paceibacterota bacterium]
MARTKVEKKEILEKLEKIIKEAQALVFVNFHGVSVGNLTQARKKLKSEKVGFFVSKKSLTKKALDAKKFAGAMPELAGEVGIVYGEDMVAPAREIYEFQKKYKGNISILGGVFDGRFMSKEEMTDIAVIPSQDILRGMFVNIISSPIQGFVSVLDQLSKINK